MIKRLLLILSSLIAYVNLYAQPAQLILSQKEGRITFAVDEVDIPDNHCGLKTTGSKLSLDLNRNIDGDLFSDWEPKILANSFADVDNLYDIGEDVVFQMLLKAWCQHRPVVLTPDAIWLIICQQFSHIVNENPEKYRGVLVNHEGKKELKVESNDLFSNQADWEGLISRFTAEIDKYTNNGLATTLVADFSTTGTDERIASEVTLMDVVKPYFDYTAVYAICGIPSITLTGTPDDWRKVLEKTLALEAFGLGWWTTELEPILQEFVKAAEGHPDYWFWKDIVNKTRPRTIQGPVCSKRQPKLTKFDGWFLKFFPYDNKGKTPAKVDITQTMLPETVVVPFKYQVVNLDGVVLEETTLELVAGIVGVLEDPDDFAMTPKIGWFVRTVKVDNQNRIQDAPIDLGQSHNPGLTMEATVRYWDEGPLTYADLSARKSVLPKISEFQYNISWTTSDWKTGNTRFRAPVSRSYLNPYASWVHPDFRTDAMLQYIQTGFDYVEICRRRAMRELMQGSTFGQGSVMKFHLDVADSFMAKLKDETQQGQDAAAVQDYARRVKAELAQTEEVLYDDLRVDPRGFGMGMHWGIGSEFYTGPVTEYLTPIVGLAFGFDFCFSRINLYIDGLLGFGGRYKQAIARDGYQWNAGERMKGGNIEVSLGYTVFDSQWWKVAPFAGIGVGVGFIDYPYHPGNPDKKSDEISGFRYQAGISADLKFFRVVDYVQALKGLSETSVRSRLYVAHTAFPTTAPSWTVNFGLSVNMLGWILK